VQSSTAAEVEECAYDPNCRYDLQWDKNMEYAFIYHFFGLLWTNQFIVGFG
jgi:choline transporter-like protein 2/4/5